MAKNTNLLVDKSFFQKYLSLIISVVVGVITFIVLIPALKNGFVNWDDPKYIQENEYLRDWSFEKVKFFFSEFYYGNYHPFTMISYLIEYKLFLLDPKPYHLHNLILHSLNVILVFYFVRNLLINTVKHWIVPFFVALLFGIHPMHVESAAWISERKDVLYALFFLISLIFYLDYIRKNKKTVYLYGIPLLFFVFSLLSKPAAVVLPIVMLAIDYFENRIKGWRFLIEKLPFFALSGFFGVIAVYAQKSSNAIAEFDTFTFVQRIMFACFGIVKYLWMLVVPVGQSNFHPYPFLIEDRLPYIFYLAPFIVLGLLAVTIYCYKKAPVICFGILFYLINIALVLQFVSVGNAVIAERYTYVSYLGLFLIPAFYLGKLMISENAKKRKTGMVFSLIFLFYVIVLGFKAHERTKVWKGPESLWTNFLETYPGVHDGYFNRGNHYAQRADEMAKEGKQQQSRALYKKALLDFNQTIKLRPDMAKPYVYRANIFSMEGKLNEALEDYNKCISIDSTYFDVYLNRAITFSIQKKFNEAFKDYKKAAGIEPGNLKIYENRSYAFYETGQFDLCIGDCNKILNINPNHYAAHLYKGMALFQKKEFQYALEDFQFCSNARPNDGGQVFNIALCLKNLGKFNAAYKNLMLAKSLGKEFPESLEKEFKQLIVN